MNRHSARSLRTASANRPDPQVAADAMRLLLERIEELMAVMERAINRQDEFILMPEVERRTKLKKSAIYARIKAKTFPAPCKDGGLTGFVEREIQAWIEARMRERDQCASPASGIQP